MAYALPNIKPRFFDTNGDPLVGGFLYSYLAGTTTPAATYSDSAGTTPNTNPIELDANGEADIWLAGSTTYKFVLTDADDVIQWTVDNVPGDGGSGSGAGESGAWTEHAITDGQSATDLDGETLDFNDYSSAIYDVEVRRGTTVIANGQIAVQNLNGTGQVKVGGFLGVNAGVTWSLSQVGMVVQLRAATSSGPGAGTIRLSRRLIPVS
jgi:hypothetical protein